MAALFFLASIVFTGFLVLRRFFSIPDFLVNLIGSFLTGSLLFVSLIYFLVSYSHIPLSNVLTLFGIASFASFTFFLKRKKLHFPKILKRDYVLLSLSFIFSLYIFFKGFGYDSIHNQFLIASNTYLDFGVHIPFIRSFSLGNNYPAEIPFYSGGNVFYHFMFDFYTGLIEYIGLRIDYAFNILSVVAFTSVLVMIYKITSYIFNKPQVGVLSVIFFLFHGSLSFWEIFQKNGVNLATFWHNVFYGETGPLGDKTIGVFWSLNTYLNQRQLIFGALFLIFFLYIVLQNSSYSKKQWIFLGVLVGLLPFWHSTIFLSFYILCGGLWVFMPELRKKIVLIGVSSLFFALPALFIISTSTSHSVLVKPGFLVSEMLSIKNLVLYWFWNLGFLIPLLLAGFYFANKTQRKLFLALQTLFLIPNFFQVSSDMYDNHKFLNIWIMLTIPFVAFAIYRLYEMHISLRIVSIALCGLILLSGVLNFMVIKNDVHARIDDYPKEGITRWMHANISSSARILSNGEIYDPLQLMGKKTYLGRSYYVYTYGTNPYKREETVNSILQANNIKFVQEFLKEEDISHVVLYKGTFIKNPRIFNEAIFRQNFIILYEDHNGIIFKV